MVRKWILILFGIAFGVFLLCACGDTSNSTNNGQNGPPIEKTYDGSVRDVDFLPVKDVQILYKGETVGTSASDGKFSITVLIPEHEDIDLSISVKDYHYWVLRNLNEFNVLYLRIIVSPDELNVQDFFWLSGKIVKHEGGEEVEAGVSLTVNDNFAYSSDDGRNFDIAFIKAGSVISARKEGYEFIDPTGIPYNNLVFSSYNLSLTDETTEAFINGERISIKRLGGITFRARKL